jgi:hypothetical protein
MPSQRAAQLTVKADAGLRTVLRRADAARHTELGAAYRDRRVGDVLAHLHAWHVVFDGWVAQDRSGAVPAYPAEGYTWKDLDALNEALYQAHRERPYEAVRAMLESSHRTMIVLLDTFTEDELTDPEAFAWLGGQAIGDVAHECLGAHYDWALRTFDSAHIA